MFVGFSHEVSEKIECNWSQGRWVLCQPGSGVPHDSIPGKTNCLISTSSLSPMPNLDTSPGFWHWRTLGLFLLSCYWMKISWSPIVDLFLVSLLIQYEGPAYSQVCLLLSLRKLLRAGLAGGWVPWPWPLLLPPSQHFWCQISAVWTYWSFFSQVPSDEGVILAWNDTMDLAQGYNFLCVSSKTFQNSLTLTFFFHIEMK